MSIPYSEIMKYQYDDKTIKQIWDYPIFTHEYSQILHKFGNGYKILDFGCGKGKIYNEILLPEGHNIEYVGIDSDPSLKGITNFPLYTLDEFLCAGYKPRHFDGLLMLNVIEHLKMDELYDVLTKLNPYIDGDIFILTTNFKCLDYMFNDPDHVTFYPTYVIYGLLKILGFNKIDIWRGKGLHRIREIQFNQNPKLTHLMEMNEMQKKVCLSLGLDWYGNLFVMGDRDENTSS
jgi:2-polyprenyl-3-methyl-5-hydroxy-6-metoxy-1,4-benzoquinol methylase